LASRRRWQGGGPGPAPPQWLAGGRGPSIDLVRVSIQPARTHARTKVPPRIQAQDFTHPLRGFRDQRHRRLTVGARSRHNPDRQALRPSFDQGRLGGSMRLLSGPNGGATSLPLTWRPRCCNALGCPPAHPCSGFYSPLAGLSRSASSETDRRSAHTAQPWPSGLAAIIRPGSPRGPIRRATPAPTH
jgi:hypothetical protein